jgi:hypothetical protein
MSSHNLMPIGYLILLSPEATRQSTEYHQKLGLYCGVDRRPPFYPPEDQIRDALGLPRITDPIERDTLERYFATKDGLHPFIADYAHANDLMQRLGPFRARIGACLL